MPERIVPDDSTTRGDFHCLIFPATSYLDVVPEEALGVFFTYLFRQALSPVCPYGVAAIDDMSAIGEMTKTNSNMRPDPTQRHTANSPETLHLQLRHIVAIIRDPHGAAPSLERT